MAASQRRERLAAIRLAAFPLGYGVTGALAGGTLNRIMVAEMGLPLTLVGFLFALPLLEAPLRVWLGYRSDGYPILGRRREPYIVVGSLIAGLGLVGAVLLMTSGTSGAMLTAGLVLAFVVYGFGRNLGHNVFQALVADRFEGSARSRALTLLPGLKQDGELTLTENTADLGGITLAHAALHRALAGKPQPKIDGLTTDQRCFVAWAQMWAYKGRPERVRSLASTDFHASSPLRGFAPLLHWTPSTRRSAPGPATRCGGRPRTAWSSGEVRGRSHRCKEAHERAAGKAKSRSARKEHWPVLEPNDVPLVCLPYRVRVRSTARSGPRRGGDPRRAQDVRAPSRLTPLEPSP